MRLQRSLIVVCLVCVPLVSWAQANDSEMDMQRLKDRLDQLEQNVTDVQKEVYRGGGRKSHSSNSSVTASPAQEEAQSGAFEEQMRAINGRIEEVQFSVK